MRFNIALLEGDGIGPEVTRQAVKVLAAVGKAYGHEFIFHNADMGGGAIDKYGDPLPEETIGLCKACDGVLMGAVGGPEWDGLPGNTRPEAGLLRLRSALGLYANLRPAALYDVLRDACPLKRGGGFDLLIVRELTGGIYFGNRGRMKTDGGEYAFDTESYSVSEISRLGRVAFEMARQRRGRLCSVDKANVLESSRLWRETMHGLREEYPDVEYRDMLVDNAAMQLIRDPGQFDVIAASNMFGDILSDEAGMLTGSIGMLPSASIGKGSFGLYEPVHGTAPDIAGKNLANPIAAILSCAMLLKISLRLEAEASSVESAVMSVLERGLRTVDIHGEGHTLAGTAEMGDAISQALR